VGTNVVTVTLAALATALATGLGAVPFFFVGSMSRRWIGISNAAAAGFMLSASGALLLEGSYVGRAGWSRAWRSAWSSSP
jgi:ZIP family zinc transporter